MAGKREEHLDVVVKTEAGKTLQFRSGEDDAHHGPAELFHPRNIEAAQLDGVAMTFRSTVRNGGFNAVGYAHAVVFRGMLPTGSAVSLSRIGVRDDR
ncbi:hypothetical protein AGR3A_Lc140419 [Agrobacterium tomkonis CFBP 6623]|uniref:Uncharacterized protein n=1 Tax=Agrobacterium tomkonis CFBP 6623 TaxID=1183432 RepID=A0A1S7RVB8_9HYPH|nr:hypothetical protein AGR3A_Lc140419 [Agrobacterium tomkonis CFBP 6623]